MGNPNNVVELGMNNTNQKPRGVNCHNSLETGGYQLNTDLGRKPGNPVKWHQCEGVKTLTPMFEENLVSEISKNLSLQVLAIWMPGMWGCVMFKQSRSDGVRIVVEQPSLI